MNHEERTRALLENAGWVRALARQLLSDEGLAEDVAQDALAVALDRPPRSSSTQGVRAWLRRVTRNLAFQALRREAARRSIEGAVAREDVAYDSADRVALQQSMARAVLGLDELYRDVVVMRYFDDLAPAEIAQRLDLPGATVRKRLSRALVKVGEALAREFGEEGKDWRLALAPMLRPGSGGWPLVPLVGTALVAVALALGGVAFLRTGNEGPPAPAIVRVSNEFGEPLVGGRAFQRTESGAVELTALGGGRFEGLDPGGGPLVVAPVDRIPEVFGPGANEVALEARAWILGSIYVAGAPPRESIDLRLLTRAEELGPEVLTALEARGVLQRDGNGGLVLRTRTGDRGFFALGGLEPGQPVQVLLPPHLRLTFQGAGEVLHDGRGVVLEPSSELIWFGALPRIDPAQAGER